jgi:hypothetical protein
LTLEANVVVGRTHYLHLAPIVPAEWQEGVAI